MAALVASANEARLSPLVVLAGPTASGKSSLAMRLAEEFSGEIVSCDSVAVYRGMEIGTAKPSRSDRTMIRHHLIDVAEPDQSFNAGDYSRLGREAILGITARGRLPIVAGGTGLYLRALIDGLFPAPVVAPALRERLRARGKARGAVYLHHLLRRLDATSAAAIHENDTPKLVRALELRISAGMPLEAQWNAGRDPLRGYRILRLGLAPAREQLYRRINHRAAAMFDGGLVEETALLIERYGRECRALGSLGYAQAAAVLCGEISRDDAVQTAQKGHRNYAKRQQTWFRGEPGMHWLNGPGDDPEVLETAMRLAGAHLQIERTGAEADRHTGFTMDP